MKFVPVKLSNQKFMIETFWSTISITKFEHIFTSGCCIIFSCHFTFLFQLHLLLLLFFHAALILLSPLYVYFCCHITFFSPLFSVIATLLHFSRFIFLSLYKRQMKYKAANRKIGEKIKRWWEENNRAEIKNMKRLGMALLGLHF